MQTACTLQWRYIYIYRHCDLLSLTIRQLLFGRLHVLILKNRTSLLRFCTHTVISKLKHCTKSQWRYCTNEYSPEGNRCRKSKVRYNTYPKIPRLCFKEPRKRVTMSKYPQLTRSIKKYVGTWALASLYAYYSKSWVCTGNYVGSRAVAYQLILLSN